MTYPLWFLGLALRLAGPCDVSQVRGETGRPAGNRGDVRESRAARSPGWSVGSLGFGQGNGFFQAGLAHLSSNCPTGGVTIQKLVCEQGRSGHRGGQLCRHHVLLCTCVAGWGEQWGRRYPGETRWHGTFQGPWKSCHYIKGVGLVKGVPQLLVMMHPDRTFKAKDKVHLRVWTFPFMAFIHLYVNMYKYAVFLS